MKTKGRHFRLYLEDIHLSMKRILDYAEGMDILKFKQSYITVDAVVRNFEIIGEALNRIKTIDYDMLTRIDNWREIIGFRNVIAHGYDVVEDKIVWESIINDIPLLLNQLKDIAIYNG